MRVEKGMYETLSGKTFDLDSLDEEEMRFLKHMERRSMLDGMTYIKYMQAVTVWDHPAYKNKKREELASCPVYKIAEDIGMRLAVKNGEMKLSPKDSKGLSESEALDRIRPDGILSRIILENAKRKARKEKK